MQELKEMKWNRNYPNKIENERFRLEKGNWGFRLIYRVYFKKDEKETFLGICHVKERKAKKNQHNIVVEELSAKLPLLNKRIKEIEELIRNNIV